MKVYVIRDSVFTLSDGKPSSNLLYYKAFPVRYLSTFDHVVMVARLFEKEDPTAKPVIGSSVEFLPLPGYHGPIGFIKNFFKICSIIWKSIDPKAAYILRVPTTVPSLYSIILYLRKIPFALEMAADPYDGYSRQALDNHPLSPFFQWFFTKLVRWQCKKAAAVAYVTREALQRRYPAKQKSVEFSFTSIDLIEEAYVSRPRDYEEFSLKKEVKLVITGNMQKTLKGHDVLLQAVSDVRKLGYNVTLTIIGYGENTNVFKNMAVELGIGPYVEFTGKVQNGAPLREILDKSDIFVLPSRQEGLPRALLEAMARGLPAIATRVGGTPELLAEHALIDPDNVEQLVNSIVHFINDSNFLSSESQRNLDLAKNYRADIVKQQRDKFFLYVKEQTSK